MFSSYTTRTAFTYLIIISYCYFSVVVMRTMKTNRDSLSKKLLNASHFIKLT